MAKRKTKDADGQKFDSDDREAIVHYAHKETLDLYKRAWHAFDGTPDADKPWSYSERERETLKLVIAGLAADMIQAVSAGREKREALEARVAELEKCPVDYKGVYEEGVTYEARSLVSHGGSMWFTPTKTKSRPNEGAPWTMCVRRGSDGKAKS